MNTLSDITNEYIRQYLYSIQKEDESFIESIRKKAKSENVPIIKQEVKQLLEVLLLLSKPKRILEVGTAVGYSSIVMSRFLPDDGKITTIERSELMILKAKENFKTAGKCHQIQILEGDAGEILPTLDEEYDFIFMDAAKGQYLTFLPLCLDLLKVGGLLVSDNTLQDGMVAKSRWSISRRNRTIHQRMRAYLWEINHHESLKTSILPIADGVTLSYKIK